LWDESPWRELLSITPFLKLRFHLCLTPACRLQPETFLPKVRGIKAAADCLYPIGQSTTCCLFGHIVFVRPQDDFPFYR
jgi:hypothetical protein